jgi:hypothetical protein
MKSCLGRDEERKETPKRVKEGESEGIKFGIKIEGIMKRNMSEKRYSILNVPKRRSKTNIFASELNTQVSLNDKGSCVLRDLSEIQQVRNVKISDRNSIIKLSTISTGYVSRKSFGKSSNKYDCITSLSGLSSKILNIQKFKPATESEKSDIEKLLEDRAFFKHIVKPTQSQKFQLNQSPLRIFSY